MSWLAVAVGGAAGAVLRYAVALALGPLRPGAVPWNTLAVNVAGSLLLGLVLSRVPLDDPRHLRPLLAVGFCGGLTTFSTFGYETLTLLQSRAWGTAVAYAGGSVVLSVVAVAIGISWGKRAY